MPSRWPCGKKAPVKSKEREKKMNTVRSALAVAACMLATGLAQAHDAASGDFGANSGRYNTSGKLNQISGFLASQLANNRDLHNVSESRIAVVSFVSIESLKETNKIGLLLAENLMHDFQIRGFPVVDFKAMNAIQVTAAGDFVLSRRVEELRHEYNVNYFLVGTYAANGDGVVINARLLDAKTSVVASSAQAFLPARDAARLLGEYREPAVEKVYIDRPVVLPVPVNRVPLKGG